MKKGSVLVKRAALFTAIVIAVAVAVSLSAFAIITRIQTNATARALLSPMVNALADLAAEDLSNASDRLSDEARLFASSGGQVWLVYMGSEYRELCLTGDTPLPGLEQGVDSAVLEEKEGFFRAGGVRYIYEDVLIAPESNGEWSKVAAVVPVHGPDAYSWVIAGVVGALIGAIVAALILRKQEKAEEVIRSKLDAIAELRDVAVAMSKGDLERRADEKAEGEIGELGKAVNHLSLQLSRNLYMLIVERNRLRNMLNGLNEGIVAIDAKGEITHTNPAMEKFFTRRKLALHLPDPRMKLIPEQGVWEDFDRVIQTGEPVTRTMESRDMTLRITITPIVDEIDAIAGAVGLFSDITQMERLERTRREYVSNVSHELRTPLTAVRALVEPLKDGLVTSEEKRQEYYGTILRQIERLTRLIEDQLELSRLQSGTVSIEKQVLRLEDQVYDVCDQLQAIAAKKNLEVRIGSDFGACPAVYANPNRVEQMLIILLDNAIKYTEEGSVTVSADWDDEKVTLHVADTGIGIEENDLPYVFDRFYKVDKAHSGRGSGLGLSIAKELLKRMDEEIWVESEKGVGTTFSFTLHRPVPQEGAEPEKN